MDASQIFTTVMAFLAPVATSALTAAAEESGKGVIETLKVFLVGRGQEKVLQDVINDSGSEEAQEQLQFQIAQAAKYDSKFVSEMTRIIENLPHAVRQIVNPQGSIHGDVRMRALSEGQIDQGVKSEEDVLGNISMEADNRF